MEWTREETDTLKELWGQKSASTIGNILGKTKNAVIGKAHRLKLKFIGPRHHFKKPRKPSEVKMSLHKLKVYRVVQRGRCQWIEGDPVPRRTTDEGKCLRPTVYRDNGQRSSYCLEHTERAWRGAPKIKLIGDEAK